MAQIGPALPPASGSAVRRGATGLAAALSLCWLVAPAAAQRIAYAALPPDERTVPSNLPLDGDEITPEEAALGADRVTLSQLSQNYRPHPAIWRIGDGDTTIYLFGTVHILPPGFAWRDARVDAIVAEADTLIVEAIDEGAQPEPAADPRLAPIGRRVSPDHRAALQRFIDSLPPDAAGVMDAMPTWIAAIAVGFTRDMQAGELPGPGADDWIEAQFRAAHKPVVAIEDGARVMRTVSAVPEAEQRHMLDQALDAPTPSRAERRAPTHAWAKGEIGSGSSLSLDLAGTSGSRALDAPLMRDRNRAWADALVRRLKVPGTALFAAGAGHFIGSDSVLALLRQRGVPVTRVQ